ncbi:Stress responsive alpha-beta barrel domain protein [Zea mays]|uniref:Stress responsive alpha-beta barrel domain protein n=1 Tax=Zea mays TaxID=4577 RepID=A0A1D6PLH8_MAIZE|nr:Stress responsive alpha-beta barrel domain protein [Zea mays]
MSVPASAQVPHTIRSAGSCCFRSSHQLSAQNLGRREFPISALSGLLFESEHRKVVEHIILLRAKPNISDAEEKDMLDYLYTSQYQMRGILAVSLGRIEDPNSDNFTHAVFMRFQQKQDIAEFQSNAYYSKVVDEHGRERRRKMWQDFNYGVEFMLLVSFLKTASREATEDALASLDKLISQCSASIVQATCGCCLDRPDNGYSHAAVIRFPSSDELKLFRESEEYKDMWASKFRPIVERSLHLHFTVDPVGNQLM